MAGKRYQLRTAIPKRQNDIVGWDLTFAPIDEEGDPVEIHLSDDAYERSVRLYPLERSAADVEQLREIEASELRASEASED
jgi:hypothetical protein